MGKTTRSVVALTAVIGAQVAGAAAPHAALSGDRFDFGSVAQGDAISHAFTVRNSGDAPLRISGVQLSLPGMKARITPTEIAPGASGTITLDWDTAHVAGTVEGLAHVASNDPALAREALTIAGTVVPAISIEPMPAVFISAFAGEAAQRTLTVRNNAALPLALKSADAGARARASIEVLEAGKTFRVTVSANADGMPGKYDDTLTLKRSGGGDIAIPLHVWIKPDLFVNPETIDFGTVAASAAAAQSVVLRHHGGAFRITSLASTSPAVEIEQVPQGSSEAFTLRARVRPEAAAHAATIAGSVRVETDVPGFRELEIPLAGTIAAPATARR